MYKYKARIKKIISGDTFIAEVDLGFNIKHKRKFKLYGIKAQNTSAADFLDSLISKKEVILETLKSDGYYAILKVKGENSEVHINREMARMHYAVYIENN